MLRWAPEAKSGKIIFRLILARMGMNAISAVKKVIGQGSALSIITTKKNRLRIQSKGLWVSTYRGAEGREGVGEEDVGVDADVGVDGDVDVDVAEDVVR